MVDRGNIVLRYSCYAHTRPIDQQEDLLRQAENGEKIGFSPDFAARPPEDVCPARACPGNGPVAGASSAP